MVIMIFTGSKNISKKRTHNNLFGGHGRQTTGPIASSQMAVSE